MLGFRESRLFLNKNLHNIEIWNEETILARANLLKDIALKLWIYPNSSYESEEDRLKLFTLSDDDVSFTGERILSFKFMEDKEKDIDSWKSFYKKISTCLYDLDPINYREIIIDNKFSGCNLKKT